MRNVRFTVRLEDGAEEHVYGGLNGREIIDRFISHQGATRPVSLAIEAITVDRRLVRITIPYGAVDEVHATVEPAAPFRNGERVRHLATGVRGVVLTCGLEGPAMVKVGDRVETWGIAEMRRE